MHKVNRGEISRKEEVLTFHCKLFHPALIQEVKPTTYLAVLLCYAIRMVVFPRCNKSMTSRFKGNALKRSRMLNMLLNSLMKITFKCPTSTKDLNTQLVAREGVYLLMFVVLLKLVFLPSKSKTWQHKKCKALLSIA